VSLSSTFLIENCPKKLELDWNLTNPLEKNSQGKFPLKSFSAGHLYYTSRCNTKLIAGEIISEAKEAPPKTGKMRAKSNRGLLMRWYLVADSCDMSTPMILEPSSGGTGIRLKKARLRLITRIVSRD
jgi:hypothetical protein